MPNCNLTTNPFNLLNISVRSTRDEIADAYEDAQVDGLHDEEVLLQAHQALIGPKTRLEAELAWLPDCSPSQARRIMEMLGDTSNFTDVLDEVKNVEGVSAANIYASLCAHISGNKQIVESLISSYDELSEEQAITALNDSRQISGFPKANRDLVSKILPEIREQHARAAVSSIIKAEHPGLLMTALVERFLDKHGGTRDFLFEIAFHFDSWSMPILRDIKDQIDQAVETLKSDPDTEKPVADIVQLLLEWDDYSQPAQLIEQEKGLDEQRSKELYDELRDICLWLANEEGQFKSALTISKALLDTFPELPSVVIQASDDIDALEALTEEAKSVELLAPFVSVAEKCFDNLETLDSDLIRKGFSSGGIGLAGELYQVFFEATQRIQGSEHEDVPWMMVRGIAIELNNTETATEAALSILEGLNSFPKASPSTKVKEQLDVDLATIRSNAKFEELGRAGERSDLDTALRLANEILAISKDEGERQVAREIKANIESQFRSKKRRWLFWGIAAAVVGFIWISDSSSKKKRTYSPKTTTAYSSPSNLTSQPSNTTSGTVAKSSSGRRNESLPPVGSNNVLNQEQIRYCVYQGERLTYLRDLTDTNEKVQKFNQIINDYNSRCSSYRYRSGAVQRVKNELAGVRSKLKSEATEISLSWLSNADLFKELGFDSSGKLNILNPKSSADAKQIQRKLFDLGYYQSSIDGIWGSGSITALKSFKVRNGLQYNGVWDAETQKALFSGQGF